MTLRCLVTGTLIRKPEAKTSNAGKPYCKGMLRIELAQRAEGDPDSALLFLTAFGSEADELAGLAQGDSVSVAGKLSISATMYQNRPQATCNVLVDRLIGGRRPPRPQRRDSASATTPAASPARADIFDDGTVGKMQEDRPW